jgi:diguanylate cyclase
MIGDDNAERWRKKYLDVLDELERKESLWKDTEAFLRQAVSKVSLAADQQDATLVKAIDKLRNSVRSGAKLDRLKHDLEVVSLAIVELDKQRQKQSVQPSPFDTLSSLIDGLSVPKGLQRKARGIDKELARFDSDADPAEAVGLVRGLIEEWLTWEREQAQPDSPSAAAVEAPGEEAPEAQRSGMLRRLFRGSEREAGGPTGTEIAAGAAAEPRSEAELAGYMGTKLAGWLARLEVGEAHDAGRRRLMTQAHRLGSEADIDGLLQELGRWVETPMPVTAGAGAEASPQAAPEAAIDAGESLARESLVGGERVGLPYYEVLIQLVQRLDFPGIMAGDVERVIEHLSGCPGEDQLANPLREVSDLIARARSVVQEEKREFESFLSELTSRLKEFEDELGISETNREETRQQREELDAALEGEVRGLQDSIEGAASLDALKSDIKKRLDTLEVHLEAKRRLETKRTEQVRDEIQTLTKRMQALEEEAEVLRINLEQQREQAYRDALTELPNRLAWDETLASEFARWQRYGRPLVLCVLDIDHFKRINDTFGHKAGDKLLRLVAKIASRSTRDSDFLARYGGEEFAMLMPETELVGAEVVAEKLRDAVAHCGAHFNQQKVPVTISCGLTAFVEGDTPESAFERADKALYRAKQGGRNRCVVDAHRPAETGA